MEIWWGFFGLLIIEKIFGRDRVCDFSRLISLLLDAEGKVFIQYVLLFS